MRRAEVVSLALADFDPETGRLTIHGGKGRKDRTTYVASGALEALHDWIVLRGREPGPLFVPKNARKTSKRAASPPQRFEWYQEPLRGKANLAAGQSAEGQPSSKDE
jgi:integrase